MFDLTPVKLDFCLARALVGHCTAPAALAAEFLVKTGKPRQHILQICIFNLRTCLSGAGAAAENLQNEPGPVQNIPVKTVDQILHLLRRQGIIEKNRSDFLIPFQYRADFLDLAFSDKGPRIDRGASLCKCLHHFHIVGFRKVQHFIH